MRRTPEAPGPSCGFRSAPLPSAARRWQPSTPLWAWRGSASHASASDGSRRGHPDRRASVTQPPCQVAQASVALPEVSIAHIGGDKPLLLCQGGIEGLRVLANSTCPSYTAWHIGLLQDEIVSWHDLVQANIPTTSSRTFLSSLLGSRQGSSARHLGEDRTIVHEAIVRMEENVSRRLSLSGDTLHHVIRWHMKFATNPFAQFIRLCSSVKHQW
jgi:hypothetical protein